MIGSSYMFRLLTLCFFIKLLLCFILLPVDAQYKSTVYSVASIKEIVFSNNFNPPKKGKPKDTSGAGSRNWQKYLSNEKLMHLKLQRNSIFYSSIYL
jgi:hypothetical protein